jgi:Zn-dependent dipeptidase, microsomal dipeptidase homolog
MRRRPFRIAVLIAAVASAQAPQDRFDRLMRDILIFDAHVDTPRYIVDEGYRLAEEHAYYETDIPRLKRGRVGAVLFGIYAEPQTYPANLWLPRALECLDALRHEVRANAKDIELAMTADDILRIHRSGKVAALASLEGGHLIGDSIRILRLFYELGIRSMTLAHFNTNNWADSMTDAAVHNGLSPYGKQIVREMNRLGMLIDVSHVSDKTVADALATSRAPVIASHSSSKAIADVPRNMPDDTIRAIAAKGGVICINFSVAFLDKRAYDIIWPLRANRQQEVRDALQQRANDPGRWELARGIERRYYKMIPKVDLQQLLRHLDHVAKIAGVDHVGIGSDFDGIAGMVPAGVEDASKYPAIVRGLMDLGYSDEDLRKIMGMNLIRVLRANQELAEK